MQVEVVFVDDDLVAVNKPAGLLVHRSKIANDEDDFLLERLQRQFGIPLYLAHRLDRATSGIVLLAKSRAMAGDLGRLFMERAVTKRYLAVVRGLRSRKAALTRWRTLATTTVPIAIGKYPEQRYALVEAQPETGLEHCRNDEEPDEPERQPSETGEPGDRSTGAEHEADTLGETFRRGVAPTTLVLVNSSSTIT